MQSEEIKSLVTKSENAAVEFKRARGGVSSDFYCLVRESGKGIVKKVEKMK